MVGAERRRHRRFLGRRRHGRSRVAPIAFSQGTRIEPTPPAAAWTSTHSPACTLAQRSIRNSAVQPFSMAAAAVSAPIPSGSRDQPVGRQDPVRGIGAGRSQRIGDPVALPEIRAFADRLDHAGGLAARARKAAAADRGRCGDRCR